MRFGLRNLNSLSKNKAFRIAIFLVVFFFTFVLRAHNYDKSPLFGHLEEHLYAWSGIYLIETGVPVSWSTLDYPKRAEVFRGKIDYHGSPPDAYVRLYKPWLDEPPLFSLLVGYFAHYFHADRHFVIPSSYIRFPMIFISALTSIFVFLLARKISGYWMGILSMLLYGTIPIIVISSRMAVPETLIALLFIMAVYLLTLYEDSPKFLYLLPIPLLAGIGGLSKPTGYFIVFFAVYYVLKNKFNGLSIKTVARNILYLLLATVPFVLAFIAYGFHFDKEIFLHIASIQGQRPVGFSSLAWFFTSPAYDITTITESWYIFALLFAFYFIVSPKEGSKRMISFAFVFWVVVVMLSGGEGDLLPWYRFPSFPLLAIIAAWGVEFIVGKADFFASFIGAGLLLGNRHLLVNAFRDDISPQNYRLLFPTMLAPSVLDTIYPKYLFKKISKIVLVGVITFGLYFNAVFIYNQFELSCESLQCAIGPSTSLSTVYFPFIWKFFTLGQPDRY